MADAVILRGLSGMAADAVTGAGEGGDEGAAR
jgi:hypothetical protein